MVPSEYKRSLQKDLIEDTTKKLKLTPNTKVTATAKALINIGNEINDFTKIKGIPSEKLRKISSIYSEKLADLKDRISRIRADLSTEDTSEVKDMLIQIQHQENILDKAAFSVRAFLNVEVTTKPDSLESRINFPVHLVGHMGVIKDMREDLGEGSIALEAITPEIFRTIIQLLNTLHKNISNNPKKRKDFLAIAISKTTEKTPFPIRKDNWILIYNAASFINCQAVIDLCIAFAELNINLTDFDPEDTTKPGWSYFIKKIPENFLNKMLNQFLANPIDHRDLFSLFGPSIKKLDLSRKNINQLTVEELSKMCPYVEELNLMYCFYITEIPKGFTRLKKLNMTLTPLSQDALNTLSRMCPLLEELNLMHCVHITEIPKGFTQLKKLNATYTSLTKEALDSLSTNYPHIPKIGDQRSEFGDVLSKIEKLNIKKTKFSHETTE